MDKTILNVSGILAFVFGIICCCTIIGAIVGVPMIIGGNKLREISRLEDEKIKEQKETILIWGVVFIFLCTISGILALIFYFQLDYPNAFSSKPKTDKYDELDKLNKLYKDKVLSKEEFETEKARILSK